ncbi:MAG: SirB2 family protein [Burkholderiales bacterium]|nr:SirB2 family protein [Burkholderiales bacterium]
MSFYSVLKHLHISLVSLSIALFVLRFFWRWTQSPHLQSRWVKLTPHLIDSLLLLSAIGMLIQVWGNPFALPWLRYKIILLCAYIALGSVALKRAQNRRGQALAFTFALLCLAAMVTLAMYKPALF